VTESAPTHWLTIVIVAFNSGDFTRRCVESLARQTDRDFEAIIVVNADEDGGVAGLSLPDERFTVQVNAVNNGFSGGSNQALLSAQTDYVMTLNPDAALDPECLARMRAMTALYPDAAMLCPVLTAVDGQTLDSAGDTLSAFGIAWHNGYQTPISEHNELGLGEGNCLEVFGPSGAAALYKREAFGKAGGFDEQFFCYFEDIDLALRLRARGHYALLAPAARGQHDGGHSTDSLPGFAIEHTSRNVLTSIVKSAPLLLLPLMMTMHVFAHFWFQVRNAGTEIARYRSRGFWRGVKGLPAALTGRFRRRPYPLGASWRVARRLSWGVKSVSRRTPEYWDRPER